MLGEGQKLSLRGNVFEKLQQGSLSYTIPDFERKNQNLIWLLDYRHDRIKAFTETAISFSGLIERKINEHLRLSYGGMYKVLRSERSANNGTFDLIKMPVQLRWSNVDSLLDPTRGLTLQLKAEPSLQIFRPQFAYSIHTFTGTFYHSLTTDKRHIFATKLMMGSIIGASKHEIPPPERFLAGSETTLRGYRYLTVSPLGKDHKVLGGRSLFVYSLELRNRIGKNFGWVIFYDIGNVYKESVPTFKEGVLQSVGLGLRYYTPIGPLKLDVAVPLTKRSIDHSVEVYFNIGQSF
jgi:translocation and assembly module TamA